MPISTEIDPTIPNTVLAHGTQVPDIKSELQLRRNRRKMAENEKRNRRKKLKKGNKREKNG